MRRIRLLSAVGLALVSVSCNTTTAPTLIESAPAQKSAPPPPTLGGGSLPDTVDWRERGVVTPVKDQGSCGSSWAFSATGALESLVAIRTGTLNNLSEQELIDCSKRDYACSGGRVESAFNYIIQRKGLSAAPSYPYTARMGACKQEPRAPHTDISSVIRIPRGDEQALAAAVAQQPVSAALDDRGLSSYRGGVWNANCSRNVNHDVLIVGYGTAFDGRPYWLIKNSWGPGWGAAGYLYLVRGQDKCGIADFAFAPQ